MRMRNRIMKSVFSDGHGLVLVPLLIPWPEQCKPVNPANDICRAVQPAWGPTPREDTKATAEATANANTTEDARPPYNSLEKKHMNKQKNLKNRDLSK